MQLPNINTCNWPRGVPTIGIISQMCVPVQTVNFGIAYGIQPQGVSDKLGCSIKEAPEG